MMNKPEVIAYRCSDLEDPDIGHWLDDDAWNVPFALTEPLIRLTDHERLQAEAERLQAARAADKARIAELEVALSELRDWYQEHTCLPACRANAALNKEPPHD